MNDSISFKIYTTVEALPPDWDSLAHGTVFLSTAYLKLLEESAPENMRCHFIGIFKENALAGIALSQWLNLSELESFGDRDICVKNKIRNFVFKRFASNVLFIGNNMLTGQNAFAFSDSITQTEGLIVLKDAAAEIKKTLKKEGLRTHLMVWKDFTAKQAAAFKIPEFLEYYEFHTQPNMVFEIRREWFTFENYVETLQKKYRDQYKRARKKAEGITKRKLTLEEIIQYNATINKLYFTVAGNAPFNTFYLPENHFVEFKRLLHDKFLFYGYFNEGSLIGFNTLIKNGNDIDTYFLGYDDECQREKMLYLNMLYDMVAYSVNKGFSRIIFARTALEIKSSVGAKPIDMSGFIKHNYPFLNLFMSKFFNYFEPQTIWQERNPFKD